MPREPRTTRTEEGGSPQKYFAMIPHTITRGKRGRGLSLPARWLYVYLKSVVCESGYCDKSTTTIVKEAQLGRGTIGPAKDELVRAGLITLVRREGKWHSTDYIRLIDIWPENMQEFSADGCTPDEQPGCTPDEQPGCTPDEQPVMAIKSTDALMGCTPDEQPGCTPRVPKKKDLKTKDKPKDLNPPPYSPPTEPLGGRNGIVFQDDTAASFNQQINEDAEHVLGYLNQVTGMTYPSTTFIKAILRARYTVEDCTLMIDWWDKVWTVNRTDQRDFFDSATPFKKDIFEKNLPKARKWQDDGRPSPQAAGRTPGKTTTAQAIANFVRGGK